MKQVLTPEQNWILATIAMMFSLLSEGRKMIIYLAITVTSILEQVKFVEKRGKH